MNGKRLLSAVCVGAGLFAVIVSGGWMFSALRTHTQSISLQKELSALHSLSVIVETPGENDLFCLSYQTHSDPSTVEGQISESDISSETAVDNEEVITAASDDPSVHYPASRSASSAGGLAALQARNPDCAAWLTIPGTVVDYPVMYKPGAKDYYLSHDFNGKKSASGALYISEICTPDSDNVIVYGHHMRSGTMFATLNKYMKKSFWESHRTLTFETSEGVHTYAVMYAFATPVYTENDFQYYSFADAAGPRNFDAYVNACASRALYETGITASYGDRLLTLCTCEYSQKNGRMLVVAKRIE